MSGRHDSRRRRRAGLPAVVVGFGLGVGVVSGACSASPRSQADSTDQAPESTVGIERVIDGDSLEVIAGGEALEVRLVAVNAPELRTPDGDETCTGEAAKAELASLLDTGVITLSEQGTDRFGRTLGILFVDGLSVNERMVASGWALGLWSADAPTLVDVMREAAEAQRGWWGETCGRPSEELAVLAHQVNPPGDDRERLDEEWVDIVNHGSDQVDLGGWILRDETTSNQFPLNDLTIEAGATVRVHVGSGPSTRTDVYLGHDQPVWSNNGETILLLRPDGVIAAHEFVEG